MDMESLDLDINHYELNDLLGLFELNHDYDAEDLKEVKKKVLRTHPDKSGLKSEYFLFFAKVLKTLNFIYEQRRTRCRSCEYSEDVEEYCLKKFSHDPAFGEKFNSLFEEHKMPDDEVDTGYEDWFRSGELHNISSANIKNSPEMHNEIEKHKRNMNLVTHEDVVDYNSETTLFGLGRDKPMFYTSELFSNLPYEDLRRAHETETVIPVSENEYSKVQKFNGVDELRGYRERQNLVTMSLAQSAKLQENNKHKQIIEDNIRSYRLIKQSEKAERINQSVKGYLRRLL